MKKCKYCLAELAKGSNICPSCGKENPNTASRRLLAVGLTVAVAALVIVLALNAGTGFLGFGPSSAASVTDEPLVSLASEETVEATEPEATIPADGNPDDETCKGTYTAPDADVIAARDTVIATAGGQSLTVGQLQAFYWMEVRNFLSQYGAYAAYFGLDYTQPMDTQLCPGAEPQMTWQQYFLGSSLQAWGSYSAMSAEADANGYTLPEDQQAILDAIAEDMAETAAEYGYSSVDDMIHDSLGAAATMEDYVNFATLYFTANGYYSHLSEQVELTDAQLDAFFEEHSEGYAASGITKDSRYVDVRHILIYPEGADGSTIFTEEFGEEAWNAGLEAAQKILDAWLEGDRTEESFAALANEHSQDPGSNTNGGLYEDVTEGEMVQAFNDWCFDAQRQIGDTDIVRTDYGYHVMFFSGSRPLWREYAESDYLQEIVMQQVTEIEDRSPMTVDYASILLASPALG